jgi:hypothetical protein
MGLFLKRLLFSRQVSLENRIIALSEETKEFLLPQDLQNISNDIKYNEFGNAFKILCIQLFEYEAPISVDIYLKIEELGRDIGIDEKTWKPFKDFVKK